MCTEHALSQEISGTSNQVALFEVGVDDLRIAAPIGVHAHECGRRQGLRISARMLIVPPELDRVEDTIDYNDVAAFAARIAEEHIALIETFALRLAEACLDNWRVMEADIRVEKVGALVNGAASCRVRLARICLAPKEVSSPHLGYCAEQKAEMS